MALTVNVIILQESQIYTDMSHSHNKSVFSINDKLVLFLLLRYSLYNQL